MEASGDFCWGSFVGVLGGEVRLQRADRVFGRRANRDSERRQPLKEAWLEREGASGC